MTRKDYVAIAEALAQTRPTNPRVLYDTDNGGPIPDYEQEDRYVAAFAQWDNDRKAIAGVLAADNPQFDRNRFYRACEGGE